jgi:hypothetical protein
MKKICEDGRSAQSIRNITSLLDEPEKLENSAKEIKTAAEHLIGVCNMVLETPDQDIIETMEKFCLYVELITKQHLPKQK